MAQELIVLLCGFTIVASVILAIAYLWFLPAMRKTLPSKLACCTMLLILSLMQWAHYQAMVAAFDALGSRLYLLLLMAAPPCFYFFSRSVVYSNPGHAWYHLLHLAWPLLALVLPVASVPAVAFIVGTAYTTWFVSLIWGLREQRNHFHFEMFFFAVFAVMALLLLIVGLALPYINPALYYLAYSSSIGLALILVVGALIAFPDVVSDIMLIANLAYSRSKLAGVDVESAQLRLETLMTEEAIYQNENLNLGELAELVDLNPHQLSELINTRYDMGFPRFLRERRIAAARKLLREQPETSILAISMMTGFKSQSNFYAAFKESTGISPGNYRQQQLPQH